MTVLAGDIGGTNTRLAIYDVPASGLRGVKPTFEQTYPSAAHSGLDVLAEQFLTDATAKIGARAEADSACFGIAGPIENNVCRATNLPWVVERQRAGGTPRHPERPAGQRLHGRRAGRHRGRSRRAGHAGRRSARRERTDRGARRGHRPRAGVHALVGAREPLPGRPLRRRARRPAGADAAGARPGPLPDQQIRPRVVRAGAVRQGAGRRVHVSVRGAGLPRADPARDRRRARDPRAPARSRRRHIGARAGRSRSGVRDGAGHLLLRAGRDRGQPGADGAGDGRRVHRRRYRARASSRSCNGAVSARPSTARAACTRWSSACPPTSSPTPSRDCWAPR